MRFHSGDTGKGNLGRAFSANDTGLYGGKKLCQQAIVKDGRLMTVSPVNCLIVYIFVLNFNTKLARHTKSQII